LPAPRCCCGAVFFGIIVMAELFLKGSTLLTLAIFAVRFIVGTLLSENGGYNLVRNYAEHNNNIQHVSKMNNKMLNNIRRIQLRIKATMMTQMACSDMQSMSCT
jgi:hypothetical protein